ncbi:hypothetical protein HUJ05_009942 [Dendroctonus ponderosae]|nr:hypothetical protein HUJ05_009942 [Dendroctonus ponderosae]
MYPNIEYTDMLLVIGKCHTKIPHCKNLRQHSSRDTRKTTIDVRVPDREEQELEIIAAEPSRVTEGIARQLRLSQESNKYRERTTFLPRILCPMHPFIRWYDDTKVFLLVGDLSIRPPSYELTDLQPIETLSYHRTILPTSPHHLYNGKKEHNRAAKDHRKGRETALVNKYIVFHPHLFDYPEYSKYNCMTYSMRSTVKVLRIGPYGKLMVIHWTYRLQAVPLFVGLLSGVFTKPIRVTYSFTPFLQGNQEFNGKLATANRVSQSYIFWARIHKVQDLVIIQKVVMEFFISTTGISATFYCKFTWLLRIIAESETCMDALNKHEEKSPNSYEYIKKVEQLAEKHDLLNKQNDGDLRVSD